MVELLALVVVSPDSIVQQAVDGVMAHKPAVTVETAVLEADSQFAGYLPLKIFYLLMFAPELVVKLPPQS